MKAKKRYSVIKKRIVSSILLVLFLLTQLSFPFTQVYAQTALDSVSPFGTTNPSPADILGPATITETPQQKEVSGSGEIAPTPIPTPTTPLPPLPINAPSPSLAPQGPSDVNPDFVPDNAGTSGKIRRRRSARSLDKWTFRFTEPVEVKVDNTFGDTAGLTVTVFDVNGVAAPVVETFAAEGDSTVIQIHPRSSMKSGRYRVVVSDGKTVLSQQDFGWGVLAVNTNKSIYSPEEQAMLGIAVLDDAGMLVCDAEVTLDITDPQGDVVRLTTKDKTIWVNPECQVHDVTVAPDYQAMYTVAGNGRYGMVLMASTKNGMYTVTDSFTVDGSVPFDVERVSATRVFPPKMYPMTINVKAREEFTGTVTETVPQSFEVAPHPDMISPDSVIISTDADVPTATESAEKISLRMPYIGSFPVTQTFGVRDADPVLKISYQQFGLAGHDGVDFGLLTGTPVAAVDDGTVVYTGSQPYGKTVILRHSWGQSYYGHLDSIGVAEGQQIAKGDEIARSGNTGELTTGPHLHFGMRLNDYDKRNGYFGKINPMPYLTSDSSIISDTAVKKLTWNLTIHKGETVKLGYLYRVPPVSPQFYLAGPLRFRGELSATPADLAPDTATDPPATEGANLLTLGISDAASGSAGTASGNALLTPALTPSPVAVPGALFTQAHGDAATSSGSLVATDSALFGSPLATDSGSIATLGADLSGGKTATDSGAVKTTGGVGALVFTEARQWQIAADPSDWYNSNWLYRKKITFDNAMVATTDKTNFPALINLASDADLTAHVANASGYDIMFTLVSAPTLLNFNLEQYTSGTGALVAWVNIPTLSTSVDTEVYMYYGNSAITTDQSSTGTWNANYIGVWHMNNSLNNYTATAGLNGTNVGTTNGTTSPIIDGYRVFVAASSQYVNITPYNAAYNITADLTISAWIKATTIGVDQKIMGNEAGISGQGGYKMAVYTGNLLEMEIRDSANAPTLNRAVAGGTAIAANTWYYAVGRYSDSGNYLDTYLNGALDRTLATTVTMGSSNGTLKFGVEPFTTIPTPGLYWNGNLDEFRVSNTIRDANWILTEYRNQNSPGTFYSLGTEEQETPALDQIMRHGDWFNVNGVRESFTF
jgi:murein DD-endopeptidase MepM/ murein hydrolase activator NlpD